jgi:2-polyprenyl-6-methoxyphenol hydroxylase-like FAD-dependent oxidoreductase
MITNIAVLIVGAGPTGLVLACDLVRRGIRCRIIDQSPRPQTGSRGFTVKPRTLEVFEDLGVLDGILASGDVQSLTRVHLGRPRLFDLVVAPAAPRPRRQHPNTVAIPQWRTEAILRERLAELGVEVEFGIELDTFEGDEDGVTATVLSDEGEERVHAELLVGCDGGRSRVRGLLALPFEGSTQEDARAMLADARVDGLDRADGVQLWMAGDGHILVFRPIPHTDSWQIVASTAPNPDGAWPEASVEHLHRIIAERTGRTDIRLREPDWLSLWRYNLRMVDRYRVGRVLLAGDAAHVHSPFGGFGMNTGIQDAYNLGWKIESFLTDATDTSILDSYETERLPIARAVLAESDDRFSGITPPAFLRPILRFVIRPILARAQRRDREDYPTYLRSRLSAETGSLHAGPHAGESSPDAVIAEGRLFERLRGPHFTLLVFGKRHAAAVEEASRLLGNRLRGYTVRRTNGEPLPGTSLIADRDNDLRHAFRADDNTIVVIRPDGYIGLLARQFSGDALTKYAAQFAPAAKRDGADRSKSHEGLPRCPNR